MVRTFNCFLLNTNTFIPICIFNDDNGKPYFIEEKTGEKVYVNELVTIIIMRHICRMANIDLNNVKLWKVNVNIEDIKNNNVSTKDDVVNLINGQEMKPLSMFEDYFRNELDNKNYIKSNIHIIVTIPITSKCSQCFTSSLLLM